MPWILYIIAVIVIIVSIWVLLCVWELCCRLCQSRNKQITDGGPPPSPGHHSSYTVTIKVDEASPTFDTQQSVLRMELLDNQNQYLTSLAVPCFVFKFRETERQVAELLPNSPPIYTNPSQPALPALSYKSLSHLIETWANIPTNSQVTFTLVRRMPLRNLSALRLTHDCYPVDAQITLKHIVIKDDATQQVAKFDLTNRPIRCLHACPPSGFQVFQAAGSVSHAATEKPFASYL